VLSDDAPGLGFPSHTRILLQQLHEQRRPSVQPAVIGATITVSPCISAALSRWLHYIHRGNQYSVGLTRRTKR